MAASSLANKKKIKAYRDAAYAYRLNQLFSTVWRTLDFGCSMSYMSTIQKSLNSRLILKHFEQPLQAAPIFLEELKEELKDTID